MLIKCESFVFLEEQENVEKKAKKTIETASAKCTNIEGKMKVLHASHVRVRLFMQKYFHACLQTTSTIQ